MFDALHRESLYLEYKSTLRWDINAQRKGGVAEDTAVKTIAGFANSGFGGTLLIGVADDGSVHGLEDDYATFTKRGERGDFDLWGQHLQNLIRSRLGDAALETPRSYVTLEPARFRTHTRSALTGLNASVSWGALAGSLAGITMSRRTTRTA